MKTRLLTTTALALGLMLPAAAMAQNSSSGSSESNKPTMNSPAPSGSSATGSSSMGTGTTRSDSTTGASGTTRSTTPGTAGTTTGTTGATNMGAIDKTIVGKSLYGANDEEVGEIDNVVMSQSGKVESVLIDVGGFLGLGSKTIAIPADDISMQGEKVVARSLTKKQAEQMPEYKKN